jgi:hypothetical protein
VIRFERSDSGAKAIFRLLSRLLSHIRKEVREEGGSVEKVCPWPRRIAEANVALCEEHFVLAGFGVKIFQEGGCF